MGSRIWRNQCGSSFRFSTKSSHFQRQMFSMLISLFFFVNFMPFFLLDLVRSTVRFGINAVCNQNADFFYWIMIKFLRMKLETIFLLSKPNLYYWVSQMNNWNLWKHCYSDFVLFCKFNHFGELFLIFRFLINDIRLLSNIITIFTWINNVFLTRPVGKL